MGRNEDGPECGEEAALHGGVDVGPDLQRAQPRREGTLEVLVDASFSPGDGHSVSGTVILLAGCAVGVQETRPQSERSVRALVELLMANVDLELYNDNRAAVVLAVEGGGQDT